MENKASRKKLPDRRLNTTRNVVHITSTGVSQKLVVTYGLDPHTQRVTEVFCSSFKAGTDVEAVVMDASVLISRLLQFGDTIEAVFKTLGRPPSLVATLAHEGFLLEEELRKDVTE